MMLSLRYALRDMRGALSSLYLVLMCLVLGVGSIAAVQFTSQAVLDSIQTNGRTILGADIIIRNIYNPAPKELRDWFQARQNQDIPPHNNTTETIEARVMLANADTLDNTLVELKIVDTGYPLFGDVTIDTGASDTNTGDTNTGDTSADLTDALADRHIVLDPALRDRLALSIGDKIRLGEAIFTVSGFIEHEPDRAGGSRFGLAPRAMIHRQDADETGLLNLGSMIYYDLRIRLPQGTDLKTIRNDLEQTFPDASWRVTDADNASPQIARYVERLMLFLTLVGLTALLIGGIGIGNGIKAHLETRLKTIAIFKSLGAEKLFIEKIYLWQVGLITLAGSLVGITIGAVLPYFVIPAFADLLPFAIEPRFTVSAFAIPLVFGFLTSFAFALWPLGQAMGTSPLELFRTAIAPLSGKPSSRFIFGTVFFTTMLSALAITNTHDTRFAMWFIVSAIACLFAFWLVGKFIAICAGKIPAMNKPSLRLALRNLHRPGNATANTLISLGLGLTVMVSITLIEMNLRQGIAQNLPHDAPAFFFLDIQKDQKDNFEALLSQQPSAETIRFSPNLRGKIVSVNGIPAEEALKDNTEKWLLQNDRGFTYESKLPAHSEITSGEWWPADYNGPPLISVVEDVQRGFGVKPGDEITVNIMGRDITAEIANTRSVNWMNLTINFAITFAPGVLESAPHNWLATVVADPTQEATIQRNLGAAFPNVSMIRLSEVIDAAGSILGNMATAVRITALVAVITGILVLAGSLAASRMQRLYDIIILKVLGIKHRTLIKAFLIEFGILGLCAGFLSVGLGMAVSWAVMVKMMELQWVFYPAPTILTACAGIILTMMIGWIITGRILRAPVAPHLRDDS